MYMSIVAYDYWEKINVFIFRELEELLSEADSRKEGYVHYAGVTSS